MKDNLYGVIAKRIDINSLYSIFIPYDIRKGYFEDASEVLGTEIDDEMAKFKYFCDKINFYPSLEISSNKKDAAGFFITEEKLKELYPELSLSDALNKYLYDVSMNIHLGLDIPSLDYTRIFKMDSAEAFALKENSNVLDLLELDESVFEYSFDPYKLSSLLHNENFNIDIDVKEFEDLLLSSSLYEIINKLRKIYDDIYYEKINDNKEEKEINDFLDENINVVNSIKNITAEKLVEIITKGLKRIESCESIFDARTEASKLSSIINDLAVSFELVDCNKNSKDKAINYLFDLSCDLINLQEYETLSEMIEEVERLIICEQSKITEVCRLFENSPKFDTAELLSAPSKQKTRDNVVIKKENSLVPVLSPDVKSTNDDTLDYEIEELGEETLEKSITKTPGFLDNFSVKDLKNYLDRYVIGQEEAKRGVIQSVFMNELSEDKRDRNFVFLVGPTGSGKTLIAEVFAEALDRPCYVAASTQLTVPGYVGGNVEDFLAKLLEAADGDLKRAQNGVLVFDEIDKKGSEKNSDVSGKGVLNLLLSLMNGTFFTVKYNGEKYEFDTSNLTVFATGSCFDVAKGKLEKLKKIDSKDYKESHIGFNADIVSKPIDEQDIIYPELETDDFTEFGNIPAEFVGRFSNIIVLQGQTIESLKKILLESDVSSLRSEQKKLAKIGITLSWTDGFIDAVAQKAKDLKTGARSLKRTVENAITTARWQALYDENNYVGIILTADSVKDNKNSILVDKNGKFHKLCDILENKKKSIIDIEEKKEVSKVYKKTVKLLTNK